MEGEVGSCNGAREIFMVLAVGFAGLLLAAVAAFTPWYASGGPPAGVAVVEVHGPAAVLPPGVDR